MQVSSATDATAGDCWLAFSLAREPFTTPSPPPKQMLVGPPPLDLPAPRRRPPLPGEGERRTLASCGPSLSTSSPPSLPSRGGGTEAAAPVSGRRPLTCVPWTCATTEAVAEEPPPPAAATVALALIPARSRSRFLPSRAPNADSGLPGFPATWLSAALSWHAPALPKRWRGLCALAPTRTASCCSRCCSSGTTRFGRSSGTPPPKLIDEGPPP
mmetsp:Transcript_112189/g.317058  ORF Transcript_112189/g.317058 Transcript_112189/m.317058 type:complete len:214 (-) Transcript_112189:473-1114(-)